MGCLSSYTKKKYVLNSIFFLTTCILLITNKDFLEILLLVSLHVSFMYVNFPADHGLWYQIIERIMDVSRHQVMNVIFGSDPVYRALHKPTDIGVPEGRILSWTIDCLYTRASFGHL